MFTILVVEDNADMQELFCTVLADSGYRCVSASDGLDILGGSADLFAANKTYIKDAGDFSANNYLGKNIFFGVREHAN